MRTLSILLSLLVSFSAHAIFKGKPLAESEVRNAVKHVAKLYIDGHPACMGTLIADRAVITASHCFRHAGQWTARFALNLKDARSGKGNYETIKISGNQIETQTMAVVQRLKGDNVKLQPEEFNHFNDYIVLQLERKPKFATPVPILTDQNFEMIVQSNQIKNVFATGWLHSPANQLNARVTYARGTGAQVIPDHNYAYLYFEDGAPLCLGDSGAGIFVSLDEAGERFALLGIYVGSQKGAKLPQTTAKIPGTQNKIEWCGDKQTTLLPYRLMDQIEKMVRGLGGSGIERSNGL